MLGPLGPRRVPGRRDWLPGGRAQGRPLGGVATGDAERLAIQVATGAAVEAGGDLAWGGRRSWWRRFSGEQIQGRDCPGGAASELGADSEAA